MNRIHIYLLLLAVLACKHGNAQSEDEFLIPYESDNQFPPDIHSDNVEGSGEEIVDLDGSGDDPSLHSRTEFSTAPKLEEIEATAHSEIISITETKDSCPKPCMCSIEGDSNEFVVDCSGYGLTEFPHPIDPKTSKLNLQKNKLTEIPRELSSLKNLKELNLNDNLIMEIMSGSVSELPELEVLKLANNRLLEYPRDLKNSLSLTKLRELDLGGNDMKTALSPETFSEFPNLEKITLATSTNELVQDLCNHFKNTLEIVCTGSCDKEAFDCPDAPRDIDEEMINATLPGMIALDTLREDKENADPTINLPTDLNKEKEEPVSPTKTTVETTTSNMNRIAPMHSAIDNESAKVSPSNGNLNIRKEDPSNVQSDVKIGANTSDTKSGGVDRSLIAIIVAGMVVVIAGVTIKKNWSSIKKRFSSTPRSPNERQGTANGTSPEEVPLQDKSPV